MIIGIGCDMVDHGVTKKLNWPSDSEAMLRIFSQSEINLYNDKKTVEFLAGRFAAKEAVLKCLGTGMHDGIALTDIQILQEESGKPMIDVSGKVKEISDERGVKLWHVSVSHSPGHSFAQVIAEGPGIISNEV